MAKEAGIFTGQTRSNAPRSQCVCLCSLGLGISTPGGRRIFWRWCKLLISRQLGPFFVFFTPFLSHKGLISRRLQEIPRKKYCRAKKTKCEITATPGFIGKAAGDEFGGLEIFHGGARQIKTANFKMKNQRRVRDTSPRLPPFQRPAGDGTPRGGEIAHDKTQ